MRADLADVLGYQCSAAGACTALAEVRLLRRAAEISGELPPCGPKAAVEVVRLEHVAALRVVEQLLECHLLAQLSLDEVIDDALVDYGRARGVPERGV